MIARTLRGLGALSIVTLGLIGWPAALIAIAQASRPWLPSLTDPLELLLRPDNGGLLLALVLAIGALAWLVWTFALLLEVASQVRGVPTPRLGGLFPQHSAAALVTAIAVAFTVVPSAPATAAPAAIGVAASSTATSMQGAPGDDRTPDGVRDEPREHEYTVVRGDTLWGIAEEELHDASQWPDIAAASMGINQPGGRHLTDPDLIHPGWTLRIPDTASASRHDDGPYSRESSSTDRVDSEPALTTSLPGTPLNPTEVPDGGAVRGRGAAARGHSGSPATRLPTTPLSSTSSGPRRVDEAQVAVAGLPIWVRPPLKPTPLDQAGHVHAAVAAVLGDR